jgi:hypothetical protein
MTFHRRPSRATLSTRFSIYSFNDDGNEKGEQKEFRYLLRDNAMPHSCVNSESSLRSLVGFSNCAQKLKNFSI